MLLASLPALVFLAILIRATSPGPAFIRLSRVGQDGEPFLMWKLRSMRTGTGRGPAITAAGDRRITDVGRAMRRTHVDELPQLLNVVAGQMALVGPRPESPEYVDLTDPRWTVILRSRPGMIGPTQLMVHRHEAEFLARAGESGYRSELLPVKLAIDEWYVCRASLRLDAAVVFAFMERLVLRRDSSRLLRRVREEVPESASLAGILGRPDRSGLDG